MHIYPLLIILIAIFAQENGAPSTTTPNDPYQLNGNLVRESTGSVGSKVCSYNTSEGVRHLRISRDKECQKNWTFSR